MAFKQYKSNGDYALDIATMRSRLQTLIDGRGMSKSDLARALNLSFSTVTRYFYETTPDLIALCIICDYFNVSLDWILGRSSERWTTLSPEQIEVADKYTAANDNDKLVIKTILSKYDV